MISPFERLVAWRYLRSKKAEGFVSVIAGFSFAGIMLGVATSDNRDERHEWLSAQNSSAAFWVSTVI